MLKWHFCSIKWQKLSKETTVTWATWQIHTNTKNQEQIQENCEKYNRWGKEMQKSHQTRTTM